MPFMAWIVTVKPKQWPRYRPVHQSSTYAVWGILWDNSWTCASASYLRVVFIDKRNRKMQYFRVVMNHTWHVRQVDGHPNGVAAASLSKNNSAWNRSTQVSSQESSSGAARSDVRRAMLHLDCKLLTDLTGQAWSNKTLHHVPSFGAQRETISKKYWK